MSELTPDVLKHALAFRGQTAQLMKEAIDEVSLLQGEDRQNKVYPPDFFPKPGTPREAGLVLKTEPSSELEAELTFSEAVALRVILAESEALSQAWGKSFKLSTKLSGVMGLSEDQWSSEAIAGFSEFGETIGSVALVHWLIQSRGGKPTETTMQDHLKNLLFDKFADLVSQDNFELGVCTANAIVVDIAQLAKENIPNMSSASENSPKTIGLRVSSRRHGAQLAADLYLEARALAAKKLP